MTLLASYLRGYWPLVALALKMKYVTKKEFFSLAFCLICLTGRAHLIIYLAAVGSLAGAMVVGWLSRKYRELPA